MTTLTFRDETHTLACMLRMQLERNHPEDFVACTHEHPLDAHIMVTAPAVTDVRRALLELKDLVRTARIETAKATDVRAPPSRESSATRGENTVGSAPSHAARVHR